MYNNSKSKRGNTEPVLNGISNKTITVGDNFDPMAGVNSSL